MKTGILHGFRRRGHIFSFPFLSLLLLLFTGIPSEAAVLFEIGRRDGSPAEFALYPGLYRNFIAGFGGEKSYYVGHSSPRNDWPYALPGPLDSWGGGGYWAGFHPRHFPSIWFGLDKAGKKGECRFIIELAGTGFNEVNSRLRVEVNGHRKELELRGTDPLEVLEGRAEGSLSAAVIDFPAEWLHDGMNKIQLGLVKGSWCIFDSIRLETPAGFRLSEASSTLIRSVEAASFEYETAGGRVQPVLVDMVQSDSSRTLTFRVKGFPAVTRHIEKGRSIQEIPLPAFRGRGKSEKCEFTITDGENMIYRGCITRSAGPLHTYADYVDLLMGTGNSRWMFKPGVGLPLGMVQIAPDNQDETWKAGYEYTVENIMGFNHFCDWTMTGFLMQPTCGALQVNPGREDFPDEGYRSRIDKSSEKAEPGRYSVYMTDTDILAEITAAAHSAMQRYTFPHSDESRILVDFFTPNEYPHNLENVKVRRVSDREIEGSATYFNAFTGYSLEQEYTVYFVLQFDKPFKSMGAWTNGGVEPVTGYIRNWNRDHEFSSEAEIEEDVYEMEGCGDAGVFLNYSTHEGEAVQVRSGVSLVDIEGARNNLAEEIAAPFGWDFGAVVENVRSVWNGYLGRIEIETDDYLQKKKFYTNLYRSLAAKATWNDLDGRYRDEDEIIRQLPDAGDCIVSGEYWNTFWNNQQLFNLIAPEISSKWARSAINLYRNSGWFNTDPAGIEHTGVMVAMHVISQILGAWQSGIRDFDMEAAYQGLKKMMTEAPQKYAGGGTVGVEHIVPYMEYGYIPLDMGMVSNTMEYAYDDWCLGQMAKILGHDEDYRYFNERSCSWRNLLDPVSGFIRPKDAEGNWIEPFDPYLTPGFTEGNAFNYTWFVPQDPLALIESIGRERFVSRLDEAMEHSSHANFNAVGDRFADFPINHGNETSMEVAWLFNWAGAPELTQKWVRAIQEQYYGVTPYDAYPGDEDLGQMSAWFVMSAIGLFQMDGGCSVEPFYELGSPRYPKVILHLDGKYGRGETFVISASGASAENCYVHAASLNGCPLSGFKIPVSAILGGGTLELVMGPVPAPCQ